MKDIFLPVIAAAFFALTSRAAPLDEVAIAAQRVADAANYSWVSTETTARGTSTLTAITEAAMEKDGFIRKKTTTVSKNSVPRPPIGGIRINGKLVNPEDPQTNETIYWGTQSVFLRDGIWTTPAEMQAAAGVRGQSNGFVVMGDGVARDGRGFGVTTITRQNESGSDLGRPAQMVLWILAQVKNVTGSGDTFTAELSHDYIARMVRGSDRNGPLVVSPSSTASARFWLKNGMLEKYEVRINASYENSPAPPMERTTTVEIKNVGTAVVDVPAEARAKFKL